MNVLETDGLYHMYDESGVPAMDGVSISIRKGVKTVILGANGAGKSTLFYHMNGIMRPGKGRVLAFGEAVRYKKRPLMELRSKVAVVLQNPDDQIFGQTVESDVAYGPTNLRLPQEKIERRVEKALSITDLEDLRDRNTMQLSYGQRKRLALAGALAMEPEVLIMDEPTAGLDPQMALDLMELAQQLHDNGTTVVMSTHDVNLAYAWADDLHVLRNGRLVYSGTSESFFEQDDQVRYSGLVLPDVFALNRSLSNVGLIDREPYPRTETQMMCKVTSGITGRLFLAPVDDGPEWTGIRDRVPEAAAVGVYGSACRRMAEASGFEPDFAFNGLESCISECLSGKDSLLLCDQDCTDHILNTLDALKAYGRTVPCDILRMS